MVDLTVREIGVVSPWLLFLSKLSGTSEIRGVKVLLFSAAKSSERKRSDT